MRTITCNAAWGHLSSLGDELAYDLGILVVDLDLFIRAKPANFTSHHKPAAAWTFLVVHPFAVHSRSRSSVCHLLTGPRFFRAGDLPPVPD